MSIHQMTANDLLSHSEVFEHIPEIVFRAEADNEQFESVQVITLQQHYLDKAYELAWGLISNDPSNLEESINKAADIICKSDYAYKKEFVEIHKNHVIIGVDAKIVTDKEINKGLAYLVSIEDFTPGERYEFGENRRVKYEFASKVSSNNSL